MDFESFRLPVLIFTVAINSFLATVVFKSNRKNATNQIFGILSVVTTLWLVDVYLSVSPTFINEGLLWVRMSIFLASAQILFFYLLAHTLPHQELQLKGKPLYLLVAGTLVVMATAISPFAFTGVNIINSRVEAIPGPGLPLFVLFAISLSFAAIYKLFNKLRNASGHERNQYSYVVVGLVMMLGLLIFTVLIPVAVFKNSQFVSLAPLYTIIFLGMTTIAIIRHRLFNIRRVIARSVTYLLVLTSFVLAYTGAVLLVSYIFFKDSHIDTSHHITYILLALTFTPTLYWLKHQFDKVTNRIFFKDAYDPQEVLNELSGAIVAEIDLHRILNKTRLLLTSAIKSSFVEFVLLEDDHPKLEVSKNFREQDHLRDISKHMQEQNKDVLITEELTEYHSLKDDLIKDGVAISLRLKTQHQVVGYVLFGEKQSGDAYSKQDEKLLSIVANELAVAIQNAMRFEEIKQFNVTLQQKVDMATKQLRLTNEKLREIDATKDEFISMASHQLRTPLTSVKGYLSMVLEGDAGKVTGTQRKLLDQAFTSSQRMVYLIADLLNVSRLKTGKFIIETTPTNLADMVEGEINQLTETAKARKLVLSYSKPKKFPTLMLDETKMRQVVMNFVDNAIYYTPSGGHIEVKLSEDDKNIQLTVEDDGIGVPKDEQPHLFGKFYRAGNAQKARPDGTGLGLFMAKKVVIAQGGNIVFHSEPGKGSTFGFAFEKAKLLPVVTEPETAVAK